MSARRAFQNQHAYHHESAVHAVCGECGKAVIGLCAGSVQTGFLSHKHVAGIGTRLSRMGHSFRAVNLVGSDRVQDVVALVPDAALWFQRFVNRYLW
jgi:hypothetical protein